MQYSLSGFVEISRLAKQIDADRDSREMGGGINAGTGLLLHGHRPWRSGVRRSTAPPSGFLLGGQHWRRSCLCTGRLAAFGFNLFPAGTDFWIASSSGSLPLSCPFQRNTGQKLAVKATAITAHSFPTVDVAFAILLKNSQVPANLLAVRPDGVTRFGEIGAQGAAFPPPSQGVTTTPVTGGPVTVQLGGIQYGDVVDAGDCSDRCSTEVTMADVPGARTYQLLFGMFVVGQPPSPAEPAALMVKPAVVT